MKNSLSRSVIPKSALALTLPVTAFLLAAVCTLPSTRAAAYVDYSCYAKLQRPDGKSKSTIVDRQGAQRLAKSLNLYFRAGAYDGETPMTAAFIIEDAHDPSQREVVTTEFTQRWHWVFERQTRYGLFSVDCQ